MTIVAFVSIGTAIGRSRPAAREARAREVRWSQNHDASVTTFRDYRGLARRRTASRVGFGVKLAARDTHDSRRGACGSVGRRGG